MSFIGRTLLGLPIKLGMREECPTQSGAKHEAELAEFREVLAAYVERDAQSRELLADATQQIEALTAELTTLRARRDPTSKRSTFGKREMEGIFAFPGVRAALLHALHSDHHPTASANERRARDEMVAKLAGIYKRIGKSAP